jgi:Type I restriction and modification enzyme - subunit R C terminal
VNVDYILMLVETYRERGDGSDREVQTLAKIRRAIDSSISLRNKRDLILAFVDSVTVESDIKEDWRRFVEARRGEELDEIIATEGLDAKKTRSFVERAFRNGAIPTTGAEVTGILPPTSRFAADESYGIKKQNVLGRLTAFYERYFALGYRDSSRDHSRNGGDVEYVANRAALFRSEHGQALGGRQRRNPASPVGSRMTEAGRRPVCHLPDLGGYSFQISCCR